MTVTGQPAQAVRAAAAAPMEVAAARETLGARAAALAAVAAPEPALIPEAAARAGVLTSVGVGEASRRPGL